MDKSITKDVEAFGEHVRKFSNAIDSMNIRVIEFEECVRKFEDATKKLTDALEKANELRTNK